VGIGMPGTRPKPLVIFDMDGVLVDSEPVHLRLEREIFARLSLPVSEDEHHSYVGMSPRSMWTAIKSRYGLQQEVEALVAAEAAIKVREIANLPLPAIDGVSQLLRTLREDGYELAIASSSPQALIDAVTEKLGWRQQFLHAVSGEAVGRGKPHPDIFLTTAAMCGRVPAQCVVIEDSSNGVRAALAAGMKCIGYVNRNSGSQDLRNADLVVDNFLAEGRRQIIELLRAVCSAPQR
jgi:HAD superfamily hydrolase (TIGR01509 family)